MAEFAAALFDLKLISQKSLAQMKTIRDGEGLGIVTFTFADKTFYGNTGGGDSYGSWLAYEPDDKLAVAYSTNAKVYPVAKIVSGVVGIYYKQQAVQDSRLGIVRGQLECAGPVLRKTFHNRRTRKSQSHQRRSNAFLSTAGRIIRSAS